MINIYKAENNILSKTEEINKGSWIDLINPTPEEIQLVTTNTGIEREIITKLLDEEELPRI